MLKLVYNSNQVQAFQDGDKYVLKHAFQAGVDTLERDHGYDPFYGGIVYVLRRFDACGRKKKQFSFIIDENGKCFPSLIPFPFSRITLRLAYALIFEATGNTSVLERLCELNKK